MNQTEINNSLKEFRYQVCYLNNLSDIDNIQDANMEDVLFVRCFPKWNMSESELKKSVERNEKQLLNEAKKVSQENEMFYSHFDIDFSSFIGFTTQLDGNKVVKYEVRPKISKIDLGGHIKGFTEAGELPPEN